MSIIKRLKSSWTNSHLFRLIDNAVSRHFLKRLKNDNFSIICSNCIGGTIYHRLRKQFLSPTINLFIPEKQFFSFCLHLKYYLSQEPRLVEAEAVPYPVGVLSGNGHDIPDVTVHFNHDNDPAAAFRKWNERKARINWDNLYLICYNLDGVTQEELLQLGQVPCRNRVVLTKDPLPEIPFAVYIRPNMRSKYPYAYLGKNVFGVRYFEKKFDFVSFLNQ